MVFIPPVSSIPRTLLNKTLISPTIQGSWDGWIGANETWTFATSTTFTVAADVTGKYQKGDKIKLTQSSTVKYFYISATPTFLNPNTTITVTGGSDYSVANAIITANFFSHEDNPFGFPDWFNYSPTLTGFSANPTNTVYKFRVSGTTCTTWVSQDTSGTSNSVSFTISAPIASVAQSAGSYWITTGLGVDNGVALSTPCGILFPANSSTITIRKTIDASDNWTASGGKRCYFYTTYQI